jgi:3-hydroxyacyl-[acyl-carrier-protein] dehydratase
MRFLLVDRIGEVEPGKRAVGWKNVAMSEDYLEWHFPEQPIVPGVLVLEALAQLAGWLEAAASGFERWFLLDRVESARYYGFAVPGDRLELRLEQVETSDPARRHFRGESRVGEERRAVVEFAGRVVPLETLEARREVERTYRQLRAEAPFQGGGKGRA